MTMPTVTSSPTPLQVYADALHDCVYKIDHLNWNNEREKKQIVKHLRAFIDRVSPEGEEHTIEHALDAIRLKTLATSQSSDFNAIETIKRDVQRLNMHFVNGDVLKEVSNHRTILECICEIFRRKARPEFNEQTALQNYRAKFNELNRDVSQKSAEVRRAYYIEKCEQLIGFTMRYHDAKAQEFLNRLHQPQANPEQVYQDILASVGPNISKLLNRFEKRLYDRNPENDAFIEHLLEEVSFLKQCVNTDLFGRENFPFTLVRKFFRDDVYNTRITDYRPSAIKALTLVEEGLRHGINDKNNGAKRILEKMEQLITTSEKHTSLPISEKVNDAFIDGLKNLKKKLQTKAKGNNPDAQRLLALMTPLAKGDFAAAKDFVKAIKNSANPGTYLSELRKTYKEMKNAYVEKLGDDLKQFRADREEAHIKGTPIKDRWVIRLLQNRDFKQEVYDFADRFCAEKDQFTKMARWQSFMRQAVAKYAPQEGEGAAGIVQAILMTCPTKQFLGAIVDFDIPVLKADFTNEHNVSKMQTLNQIFEGMNSASLSAIDIDKVQATLQRTKRLSKYLTGKFRSDQVQFDKMFADPLQIQDLKKFKQDVKQHERNVKLAFEIAFSTACNKRLGALQASQKPQNRFEIDPNDVALLYEKYLAEKDNTKKLSLLHSTFSALYKKSAVNKASEIPFLKTRFQEQYKRDMLFFNEHVNKLTDDSERLAFFRDEFAKLCQKYAVNKVGDVPFYQQLLMESIRSDAKFFNGEFINEKDDVKRLALFQAHFTDLCRKYAVNKADESSFLQRVLIECLGDVGSTIMNIDRDYVSARVPGERIAEQRARQEAYQSLIQAVEAIVKR